MWLHFIAYLGLSGILSYASHDVAKPAWQIMIGVFVVTVGIGTAVEVLQLNLPARTFSTADIAVNALGAATGTILFYISERVLRRLRTATRSSTRL
jgi:VanZ family protein